MGMDDIAGPGGPWQRYRGGTRHTTSGKWATVSKYGSMALTAELTKAWPKGYNFLWVEFDPKARKLRLVPTKKNEPGCLGWRTPRTEQVARLSMMGALRRFGLLGDRLRRYSAAWVEGAVVIDLTAEQAVAARTSPKPKAKAKAAAKPKAASGDDAGHEDVLCTECGKMIPAVRIGRQWVLDDHKAPDGEPCEGKTVRIVRGPAIAPFGKGRPKVRCVVCGAVKTGVRRGALLMPFLHDGRGGSRCPGAQQEGEAID